ncbi:MAG: selenocysteine-specific translation elongation factor, partial [Bryobacterales bacterium]|nr:selenocysteine-specific translation elongation factor [Bryobacteraceae bacterium]MDW8129001.1 selenocysteine-specific translation elongation factor [Bryobacterales bacterium]
EPLRRRATMKHVIAGTAGHIDHGKTALVRALTGIDTDRLEEEKRRGISIDLGFAHLDLGPELRIGFVDVPGHERFVKNMLAGAWGIDLVVLVVAADESIKPQTREHFDICRLLGIQRGLVALTKADLVEADLIELVKLEIEEFVRGSFLEGAPVIPVSAATGQGLEELKTALRAVAAATPEKDASRHFRLPVDRSFTLRGFGTVVTGTLVSGAVRCDEEVEAHPLGRRLRVRGIQVHGEPVERARAGQRTALNVAGAEPAELPRGTVLTAPGLFRPVTRFDCRLELLASAKPLKDRAPVHFHAGTAEIEAEVRLLEPASRLEPGSSTWARLVLREPALVLPGDRFIIRMFSPVVTIGGGTVVDIAPRRYRHGEHPGTRLAVLASGSIPEKLSLLVGETRYGSGLGELVARTGLLPQEIEQAAPAAKLVLLQQAGSWLVSRHVLELASERLCEALAAYHRANPLRAGMPREEARNLVLPGAPAFLWDEVLGRTAGVVAEGDTLRLATHSLTLSEEEHRALETIEASFRVAGWTPPTAAEALARAGLDAARARRLLELLLRKGTLVRLSDEMLFHAAALAELRALVSAHKGERFDVARFKQWTGLSRKYAIPLLEYLDRERVTRRDGDQRIVL